MFAVPAGADAATITFGSTGAQQVFTVPAGVSSVHVVAIGAPGASSSRSGGLGGRVSCDLPASAGQTLFVEVGGKGNGSADTPSGAGGFNGGASGGMGGGSYRSPGGGGASDVRTVSASQGGSLASRLIVAGGGGGAGLFYGLNTGGNAGSPGGNGGNSPDATSGGGVGGGAGTSVGGGAGGAGAGGATGTTGTLGSGGGGGDSTAWGGGGGGGGFNAGGGGGGADPNGSGGGGGGSSFTDPVVGNASIAVDSIGVPSIAISYQDPGGGGGGGGSGGGGGGGTSLHPAEASFRGSKSSIRVDRKRRFKFSFHATPGLKGTAVFKSVKKVRVSRKGRVRLARKSFTVPASGKVTLRIRLSKKNFRILKLNRKIRTRVTVTLKNAAGLTSTASKKLTLKAPKRRRR